ncbi:hypothetical protein N2152v2_007208 [Parachlorella kessleri]
MVHLCPPSLPGVWEKDEIRKDDSFVSFEEVFEIAAQQNVDLVLLGGDLFHDNKPSRNTIVRAMDILSRHCLNDRPVAFQVLSDQHQNFVSGQVNFENPNYNVGLPVFTIHGNHDDPAGAENLSAVDILSSCSLLNYFGKIAIAGAGVGKVRISPVLLAKGDTKLALYGLGNLRDERLARLFQTPGCVEWVRPQDTPDIARDDWFNLFVLHQNRVAHGVNAKNSVREAFLARFLDLIVWGHEHECLADPWESAESGGSFSVLQPGSSVATALSEGEAKRKHAVLLEIMGQQWRTVKFPLETVRPFIFESVALADVKPALDPDKPEVTATGVPWEVVLRLVTAYLQRRVTEMIEKAARDRGPRTPPLPLVRLRVDYSGFSTINTQRFGQVFVGKVANPHDMILWQKAAARKQKDAELAEMPRDMVRPEALDEARIEDLIAQHLTHNLEILPENVSLAAWRRELATALHEFVEKDNRTAIQDAVSNVLKETQTAAVRDERTVKLDQEEDLKTVITNYKRQHQASQANASVVRQASQLRGEGDTAAAAAAAPGSRAALRQQQSETGEAANAMEVDGEADPGGPGPSHAKPAAGKGGGGRAAAARPPRAPSGGGKGRQAKLDMSSLRSPLNFEATGGSQRGGRASGDGPSPEAPASSRRPGSTRAAAGKATQKMANLRRKQVVDDEDDLSEGGDEVSEQDLLDEEDESAEVIDDSGEEDEVEELASPRSRKRGRAAAAAPAAKPGARGRKAAPAAAAGGGGGGGGGGGRQGTEPAMEAVNLVDSEDDEPARPAPRRRMAAQPAAGSRSQFGGLGTNSQMSKGWGSVQ